MADPELKERLREHSNAFDSLLTLIPAKHYYGEDTSDQWKRKKQTKDEARAARRNKLNPDSALNRNAKEVMDERAKKKRKLKELEYNGEDDGDNASSVDDDEGEEPDGGDSGGVLAGLEKEKPGEGLRKKKEDQDGEPAKKLKLSETPQKDDHDEPQKPSASQEKKLLRRQKKQERKAEKKQKRVQIDEAMPDQAATGVARPHEQGKPRSSGALANPPKNLADIQLLPSQEAEEEAVELSDELRPIELSGLAGDEDDTMQPSGQRSQISSSGSSPGSPTFDSHQLTSNTSVEPASTATSISSTVGPSEKPKHIKIPSDTTALRARLAAKIEALRAARKADGVDGKPIRTRQELIEARRAKQAQRKAHKQELRRQAKEEEERKREEALASARTSPGSVLSPLLSFGSPADEGNSNYFAFGRVAFADGVQMSHDLSYVKESKGKRKGPSDPKTALAKLEAQKKRISRLDEDKRKEVLEKETWLAARRRAEGEKVKDDENLLKKTVKRKEKAKKKSEREWKDRARGVEHSIKQRQQKREENIKKRRDDKLLGKAGKKKGGKGAKKNRPGFEGALSVGGRKK
ncbi:Ribosomal RNA-processing protein 14 [Pleurostoma richardsiae]|uniref:Ribosomal RNA-processing protein 14 n=1 Tax=Pleurostoma richardsiae TaxID=41990 RepID=A0AA38VRK8_9PEZI|nr:Ribosomal RNA-processing protein 14 [Pleurostoma richardsiae]